jgi:NAD(P)-dependent dehydrogenase (short-subunit alcohol dehydrogenase family)
LVSGDISNEEHCKEIINRAVNDLGGIDILENNAAYQMRHESLQELSSEELDKTFKQTFMQCSICVKQQNLT